MKTRSPAEMWAPRRATGTCPPARLFQRCPTAIETDQITVFEAAVGCEVVDPFGRHLAHHALTVTVLPFAVDAQLEQGHDEVVEADGVFQRQTPHVVHRAR